MLSPRPRGPIRSRLKWATRNRTRTADASVSRTARGMDSGPESSVPSGPVSLAAHPASPAFVGDNTMTVQEQEYPEYFPEGCPPEDANTDEQMLYRFCSSENIPREEDFVSYYQRDPLKYKGNIPAYGLSVMKSREDCLEAYRKSPYLRKYKSIAKGKTNEKRGSWKETPSRQNPAHVTWWVCNNVKPLAFFQHDMNTGE